MNKRTQLLLLLIIGTIVIILPTMIRILQFKQVILPGDSIYYDIRMAKDISSSNLFANDQLVFTQAEYNFNPLHYILAALFFIIPPKIAVILLSLALSLLSIMLLYKIMERLAIADNYKIMTIILYIVSPNFISSALFLNKFTIGIVLFLLFVYLVIINTTDKLISSRLTSSRFAALTINIAIISLAIILFYISLSFLLYAVLFLLFYALATKRNLKKVVVISAMIIAVIFFLQQFSIIKQFSQTHQRTVYANIFQETIAELGAASGFAIFSMLLFVFGIYVLWKRQLIQKNYLVFILAMMLIAYYLSDAKYLLNIFVSIIAAVAFIYFIEKEWSLSLIKDISLFILILGVIFSGLSTVARIATAEPTRSEYNAAQFLQQYYENNSNKLQVDRILNFNSKAYVLSYYKYGHLLQSVPESKQKLPVFFDTNSYETGNYFTQFTTANEIFYSRDIKKTTQLFSQYQIKYIFITPSMSSGIVWKKDNQGLLFLLKNSEKFKNIYNKDGIEIWEFSK